MDCRYAAPLGLAAQLLDQTALGLPAGVVVVHPDDQLIELHAQGQLVTGDLGTKGRDDAGYSEGSSLGDTKWRLDDNSATASQMSCAVIRGAVEGVGFREPGTGVVFRNLTVPGARPLSRPI